MLKHSQQKERFYFEISEKKLTGLKNLLGLGTEKFFHFDRGSTPVIE